MRLNSLSSKSIGYSDVDQGLPILLIEGGSSYRAGLGPKETRAAGTQQPFPRLYLDRQLTIVPRLEVVQARSVLLAGAARARAHQIDPPPSFPRPFLAPSSEPNWTVDWIRD